MSVSVSTSSIYSITLSTLTISFSVSVNAVIVPFKRDVIESAYDNARPINPENERYPYKI